MRKIEHRPPPPPPQPIAPPGMAKVRMAIRLPTGGKLEFDGIIGAEAAGTAFMDIIRAAENDDRAAAQGADGQHAAIAASQERKE